jgi:PKD repeat protein
MRIRTFRATALGLGTWLAVLWVCAGAQANDLTFLDGSLNRLDPGDVTIEFSQARTNRRTGEMTLAATVRNDSGEAIPTPVYLAIAAMSPDSVVVNNAPHASADVPPIPYFVLDGPFDDGKALTTEVVFAPTVGTRLPRFTVDARAYNQGSTNQAPVANAGPDLNLRVGDPVFLDGTASYDPDNGPGPLTFQWSPGGAPPGSAAVLDDPTRPDPQFQPDLPGSYDFELIVSDGALNSTRDEMTLTAFDGVTPPNADAGPDRNALVGQAATLDGSGSSDPAGLPLAFTWAFQSVAGGSSLTDVDISGADTATPSFTPDTAGIFVVELEVDNQTATDVDTVEVTAQIANVPPNADAGPDQFVRTGEEARLDGSASADPDGGPDALTFDWSLISVPPGSNLTTIDLLDPATATPGLVPDVEGTYISRLEVDDGQATDSDNTAVVADDTPPLIVFLDPTDEEVVDTTTPAFQIGYSDAGSGLDFSSFLLSINGIDVTPGSVATPTGAAYSLTAALPAGDNQASTQIRDLAGNLGQADINFTVSVFRAIADCAPLSGTAPLTVRYRSRGEFTGGSIVRYRWDFDGNGTFDTNDSVARDYSRTWSTPGTIQSTLQVTNNFNDTATDTCIIQVGGNAPTATANASPSNGPIPLDVNFTCTGSDDGSIVLYEWDFDGDCTFDFSSPSSGSTTHTYNTVGSFEAVCRVTDNDGLTGQARTTATTIVPRPPGAPTVTATASPTSGNSPLTVSFNGSANDGGVINATIVLWEWDFDGDAVFDYSSPTSPATIHTYTEGGAFGPTLRATDNDGDFSQDSLDILVDVSASLSIPDDTLDLTGGATDTVAINTSLGGDVPVRLFLKNEAGDVVRTLVDEVRTAGSYSDLWDGRDDAGDLLAQGPYYAILEYQVGDDWRQIDLTNSTGGVRYNPSRNRLPSTFSPFEDDLLEINFTVPSNRGASEIQAFVGLFNTDTRIVTLLDRDPLGVGQHTIYWNGLDGEGNLAVAPPGDRFLFGIWGFTLPDNAIFIQSAPVLSSVMVDPNFYDPATPNYITPERPTAIVTFDLNQAATVQLVVTNLATGKVLRRIQETREGGTQLMIAWDGNADDGRFADAGDYRLELRAIDSAGSVSLARYALVRVFY